MKRLKELSITKWLLKSWSDWVESYIFDLAKQIETVSFKVQWIILPDSFTPSENQLSLIKNYVLSDIFWIIAKKLRYKKIYDKDKFLLYVKNILEDYLNWKEVLDEDKVKIWVYYWVEWWHWFVDFFDKDAEWRKTYYSKEEFIKLFDIKSDNKNIFTQLCGRSSEYQSINDKSWFICVDSIIDWWNYIIHLDWLNEFQKTIIKGLFDKIIDVIKEKLNSIENNYRDTLTWCKKSAYFNEHAKEKNWSVIAIDLDEFKPINDNFWHSSWDEVLKRFWKILRECVRENEWEVIRMWWDEFCIVIKQAENWSNKELIEKVISRLEHVRIKRNLKITLPVLGEKYEKEVEIKYSFWIFENNNKWEKLTLEECYTKADEKMLEGKWPWWITSRVKWVLSNYWLDTKAEVILDIAEDLRNSHIEAKKQLLLDIAKKLWIDEKNINISN